MHESERYKDNIQALVCKSRSCRLVNGLESCVMSTVMKVVEVVRARYAAPALAAHHVEAWFSWNR